MQPNNGSFILGGGKHHNERQIPVVYKPNVNKSYIRELLGSQKGDTPSREVTEEEEEQMMNEIWNQYYRDKGRKG